MAVKSKKKKKSVWSTAMGSVFPCKGDSPLEAIRKIIFLISVIVFTVCAYLVFDYFYENYQNRQLYGDIASIYDTVEPGNASNDAVQSNEKQLLPGAE